MGTGPGGDEAMSHKHKPSMHNNWFVPGPPLSHTNLVDDMNEGLWIGTQTLSTPLVHLKLSQLLNLSRLNKMNVCINMNWSQYIISGLRQYYK